MVFYIRVGANLRKRCGLEGVSRARSGGTCTSNLDLLIHVKEA